MTYIAPNGYLTISESKHSLGVAEDTVQRTSCDNRLKVRHNQQDKWARSATFTDVARLVKPISAS